MGLFIRGEMPDDYRVVEEINREAFWNLYCPGCEEHFLAHEIRKHEDFIPELSFVLELDGKLIGSILYTKAQVVSEEGQVWELVSFGPVAILPEYHRQGYGRLLITHSIEEAKKQGYQGIIIGGFPYHYQTYGFVGSKKYGISMEDGKFYTGIMALPLYEGALDEVNGKVIFSKSLEVDPGETALFDQAFPEKEKKVLPCQKEFEAAVSDIDTAEY